MTTTSGRFKKSGKTTDRWSADVLAVVGGYRSVDVLAQRGMTCTVKALQREVDDYVVLDVLDPQMAMSHERAQRSFIDDARKATGLKHPHLTRVLEAGACKVSGLLFAASEFVEGQPLEDVVGDGRLDEDDAVALCQGVAEALAYAAERRISHGSLSPETILLDRAGTPRLTGLGIFRPRGTEPVDALCLAPEQVQKAGDVDPRVDLYALGITLYRCLTGKYPFQGDSYNEVAEQHVRDRVPDPRDAEPGLSKEVSQVVAWLTNQEPMQRYPTPHAASLDLLRLLGGHPPQGPGAKLKSAGELPRVLAAVQERRPQGSTPRGLWGRGPAFAFKVVLSSREKVLRETCFNQESLVLGRSPSADVQIDNPIVSREHSRILRVGGHFLVEPISKTNATALGKRRVQERAWFRTGQTVVLSDKFHLRLFWQPNAVEPVAGKPPADTKSWVSPPTEKFRISDLLEEKAQREAAAQEDEQAEPVAARAEPAPPPPKPPPVTGRWRFPEGHLVFQRGGLEVRSVLDRPFQIGRSMACDLRLAKEAPYKAALVIPCADGYRLYNLVADAACVLLNGEPVPDQAVLQVGDTIEVAGVTLRFLTG